MTVLDASGKLFSWFQDNDSFCLQEDLNKVILITEDRKRDTASLRAGLKSLEEGGLIKEQVIGEAEYWVLSRPFESFEQTVELSAPLTKAIAEQINGFCDLINDQRDRCDAASIKEKDIRNLVFIYDYMKNGNDKESDQEGGQGSFTE